jgi:hypothetical protein
VISFFGYIYFFYFGEKVKILIPKGYIGPVIITFDCSQGDKKERKVKVYSSNCDNP